MTDAPTSRRGGRSTWLILAVVALIAIATLALYMNRGGGDGPALRNTTAEAATGGALRADADRSTSEPEANAGAALEGSTGELAAGAREVAASVETATERVAGSTVEGAREAVQTTEEAIERSTDGDPDSDRNERR